MEKEKVESLIAEVMGKVLDWTEVGITNRDQYKLIRAKILTTMNNLKRALIKEMTPTNAPNS